MRERDSKRKLVDYFKKNLEKGYTQDTLKYALISQGYSRAAVDIAIESANKELAIKAPILKEKPVINYEVVDEADKFSAEKKPWWKKIFFWTE